MKTCSRWRVRARFTSGLYSTENLGRSSLGEIGGCSGPGFVVDVSTVMPGIVSEVMRDIVGVELEFAELDV